MKLNWSRIIFWLIVIVAIGIRVYRLGELPYGFHVDEAKLAWNAWSIWKTGADDWQNKFPMYYNSFGDYRPTGIFYLIAPVLGILGRSVLAVRILPAMIGGLTVVAVYFLVRQIADKNKNYLALMAAGLLAINPWHINVSRATSEVIVSIFLAIWGLVFLVKTVKEKKWLWSLLAILFLGGSCFFYHTIRVLAPLMAGITVIYFWKTIRKKNNWLAIGIVVILGILTIFFVTDKNARGRMNQVSVFKDLGVRYQLEKMPFEEGQNKVLVARIFHNKAVVYGRRFVEEYLSYINPSFLVNNNPKPERYMTSHMGLMTYAEVFILLVGLVVIARGNSSWLLIALLLISPIVAAMTTEDAPNLHRAMLMVPFLVMIEAVGVWWLIEVTNKRRWIIGVCVLGWGLNWIYYWHMYSVHTRLSPLAYSRNAGETEMVDFVNKNSSTYNKVILPSFPDSPYPWLGFFGNYDAEEFNKYAKLREAGDWSSANFVMAKARCPSDKYLGEFLDKKIWVVDGEGCEISPKYAEYENIKTVDTIKRPDGSPVYTIRERGVQEKLL